MVEIPTFYTDYSASGDPLLALRIIRPLSKFQVHWSAEDRVRQEEVQYYDGLV